MTIKQAVLEANTWKHGLQPTTKLAGLPLVLRTILALDKAGLEKLIIIAGDYENTVKKLIARRKFQLEIEFNAENYQNMEVFQADKLYDQKKLSTYLQNNEKADEKPVLYDLGRKGEFKNASRHLWSTLKKPIENDGVVAYYLGRPLSRIVSKILINTPITPNQVTIFSFIAALAGAYLVATPSTVIAGAVLYWVSFVFDCVDGELARLKYQGSRTGQWLDTIIDDLSTAAFTVGLSFLAGNTFGSDNLVILGITSAILYEISAIFVYITLARMNVVDTAQYPFFFLGEGGAASEKKGFFTYLAYLFRRDVILFIHLVLAIFSLFKLMLAVQLLLNFGMALLTLVDKLVKLIVKPGKTDD
ncbi:MAG: CDP-alcohol phosphatidyltransferase family protein [Myxococcota bacterium]